MNKVRKQSANDILSSQEYLRKRADLVEGIIGKKIEITYSGQTNWITKGKDGYVINIAKPMVKGLPTKTALYHEVSHALHKTFLSGCIERLKKLAHEDRYYAGEALAEAEMNHATTNHFDVDKFVKSFHHTVVINSQSIVKLTEDEKILVCDALEGWTKLVDTDRSDVMSIYKRALTTMYIESFNILEDQRIESLTSDIWLATKSMFNDAKEALGKQITNAKFNPNSQLLSERFFRVDLVKDNELAHALHLMEGADETLPYLAFKKYVHNKCMKDAMLTMCKIIIDYSKDDPASYSDIAKKAREASTLSGMTTPTGAKKTMEQLDEQLQPENNSEGINGNITQPKKHRKTALSDDEESEDNEIGKKLDEAEEEAFVDEDEWLKRVEASKQHATQEVTKIKDKLTQSPAIARMPANCTLVKRKSEDVEPNDTLVKSMGKLLRTIQENKHVVLNDTGDEIDIDSYVNAKLSGHGDCYTETKEAKGISIYISVDGSGSMDNGVSMDNARTLVASLFRVSQDFKEIEIRGDVWSSNYHGDVGITEINTLDDCKYLSTHTTGTNYNNVYYETPTHEAIKYSSRRASEGIYTNKLLIIITDGYPQYTKKGYQIPHTTLIKMAQKNLKKALQTVPNIMCVSISGSGGADHVLKEIFTSKRLVSFNNMVQAKEFIEKDMKRRLVEVLK